MTSEWTRIPARDLRVGDQWAQRQRGGKRGERFIGPRIIAITPMNSRLRIEFEPGLHTQRTSADPDTLVEVFRAPVSETQMRSVTHPLTGETLTLDLEAMRAELERVHGIDLRDMSATSVAMNYSALLRQRQRAEAEEEPWLGLTVRRYGRTRRLLEVKVIG